MGEGYTQEELDNMRTASRMTSEAREYGKKLIKRGKRMVDVCDEIDSYILEKGFDLAFPSQISLNECAAHYGAMDEDPIILKDQLVKLDLGAMYKGAIGDTAISVDLSDDGRYGKLIEAAQECLRRAIEKIKPGIKIGEIGRVIGETAEEYGFTTVRNLSGHGIGIDDLHGEPKIPNYDNGDKQELKEGMTIAIEPFVTDGAGFVEEKGDAELFMLEGKANSRSMFTREFLKNVQKFKGCPFARRYLDRSMGKAKVNFAIKDLYNMGAIHKFPSLLDKDGGAVAQAEHSILVTADGCEVLTE